MLYLHLLRRYASRNEARILGYCLMTNHVHLIVIPERVTSLARTLGGAHAEYALALNRSASRSGHLWQNRYFSCPLDERHLDHSLLYVDLNPVRAGLVADACGWRWSSARAHCAMSRIDPVLDADWADKAGGWDAEDWQARLSSEADEAEAVKLQRATIRGEPLGSREFIEELERRAGRRLTVGSPGRPPRANKPKRVSDTFFNCV